MSKSPSPAKFLQAADGKAPDELYNLSSEIPKAKHNQSNASAVRLPPHANSKEERHCQDQVPGRSINRPPGRVSFPLPSKEMLSHNVQTK